jgi:hypothetical protein
MSSITNPNLNLSENNSATTAPLPRPSSGHIFKSANYKTANFVVNIASEVLLLTSIAHLKN